MKLQNSFEVLANMQDQLEDTGVEDKWQMIKSKHIETGSEVVGYVNKNCKVNLSWHLEASRGTERDQDAVDEQHRPHLS